MKKIILLLALTMTCEQVAFQGSSILRCYNDEAVCYVKQGFGGGISCLAKAFNIAPFDGDWKDSLIKVENKEEE